MVAIQSKRISSVKVILFFVSFLIGSAILNGAGYVSFAAVGLFYFSFIYHKFSIFKIRNFVFLLIAVMLISVHSVFIFPLMYVKDISYHFLWVLIALLGARMSNREFEFLIKLIWYSIIPYIIIYLLNFDFTERLQAYLIHPNHLAYVSLFSLFYFLTNKVKNQKLYISIILVTILLTRSSGGLISTVLLFFTFYITDRKINLSSVFVGAMILLFLLIASFYAGILDEIVFKFASVNLDRVLFKASQHSFGAEGSLLWRISYWVALFQEFLSSNNLYVLLLGEGSQTMSQVNYVYDFMYQDPHNDYVRIILERGFLGGLIYLFFILKVVLKASKPTLVMVVLLVPMIVGNIIVSFPFMCLFLLYYTKMQH